VKKAALLIGEQASEFAVRAALESAGHTCIENHGKSAAALLRALKRDDCSLVIVDSDEPTSQWRTVLDWRRNWLNPSVIVIVIGSASSDAAEIALEAGADDFVLKPIQGAELLARIQIALRRQAKPVGRRIEIAGCALDCSTNSFWSSRGRILLTAREMAVAQVLFENVGHVVSRRRLAADVWGSEDESMIGRSIEQHIYQLRRKLKRSVGDGLTLQSVYGSGYRLNALESKRWAILNETVF
jgi:DNA-binding response OmpR family regulator